MIDQTPRPTSVPLEAHDIVNGPRAESYGDAVDNFRRISKITNSILSDSERVHLNRAGAVTPAICCKVLMAVKLGRQAHSHGRDNLVDLCGYAEILNRLEEAEL